MLGVWRAGVTGALNILVDRKLIRANRGQVDPMACLKPSMKAWMGFPPR